MITKEDILARLTPFDVYGSGLLKGPSGFKMLCPFHEETKASFIVRNNLSFYCFGCGRRGTPFDYVMTTIGTDFAGAFRYLAERAAIDVGASGGGSADKFSRMSKITAAFVEHAQRRLMENKWVMKYLIEERKLSDESIRRFRLGYTDMTGLQFLRDEGVGDEDIEAVGLGVRRRGVLTALFVNRLMFPIVLWGQVRGFGGRVVADEEPKYLNSPTTPLFQKRKLLYGFDPSAIREKGYAIIVEGYFDVIMLHQTGFKNTVAPLGTILTEEHIALISKHTDRVVLIYDGDSTGRKASERSVKLLYDSMMKGSVAVLPNGEDPDTFLRKGGDLVSVIGQSTPFAVFLAQHFPETRSFVFNSLLKRSAYERVEFLAHVGTVREARASEEISARSLIEADLERAPCLLRQKDVEVKQFGGNLVVFRKKRMLFWVKADGDGKAQAADLVKRVEGLWKHGKRAGARHSEHLNR